MGGTDAGSVEDELIAILHCIKDDIRRFFSVQAPSCTLYNLKLFCLLNITV